MSGGYISKTRQRRRIRVISVASVAALVLGASAGALAQSFVPGEIVVKPVPASQSFAAQAHTARGTQVLQSILPLGVERLEIPASTSVEEMVALYENDPIFEYAEPVYIGEGGLVVPNDTDFGILWHHQNFGANPDADIDSVEGWVLSTGSSSIRVAILDTGIDSDHPEFAGRILAGYDFVNSDSDPEDDHSHGTHAAGLLAANADNAFAVAGVDQQVGIVPVKVLNSSNFGTTIALAEGLLFAKDNADVISMSLINYPATSSLVNDALQAARDSGAILIACAGNGGSGNADVSGPGASPLTISVGATTQTDARAFFSATGSALDLVAPGYLVHTVAYNSSADTNSLFSGCSAATPVTAGVATLLLSINPMLTHDQILDILTSSADDQVGASWEDTPGRDDYMGWGRLNMYRALLSVSAPVPAVSFAGWVTAVVLLVAAGSLGALGLSFRGR